MHFVFKFQDGTMICDRKVCAPLDCATDEIILDESSCCPRCQIPKKKCRYRGKVYKVCNILTVLKSQLLK